MLTRILPVLLLVSLSRAENPIDPRALLQTSLSRYQVSNRKLGDYCYVRRVDRKEMSSAGKLRTEGSLVFKREPQNGLMVTRLLERDGKPLPEDERRKNEETIRKRLAEVKEGRSPEQIEKRRAENRKSQNEEDAWIKEFPEAMEYRFGGEEIIDGRLALVLDFSPRNGYRAKSMRARLFEKIRGRVWIDKADSEIVKADAEFFETASIAWGLVGRIQKGSRFFIQRQRLPSGDWLPQGEKVQFAGRMLLVKSMNSEITTRYADLRHRSEVERPASSP